MTARTAPRLGISPQLLQGTSPLGHALLFDNPFNKRHDLRNPVLGEKRSNSLLGARRELVNRILLDWRQWGLIAYERGKITILDLPAVEDEPDRRVDLHADDEGW